MLENERIIVQDRGGIDAGIAALMQNANKGFDPAALMAMMNNGICILSYLIHLVEITP